MSNITISQAEMTEDVLLKDLSMRAFEGNFEKYGHYPPGIESVYLQVLSHMGISSAS